MHESATNSTPEAGLMDLSAGGQFVRIDCQLTVALWTQDKYLTVQKRKNSVKSGQAKVPYTQRNFFGGQQLEGHN